MEKVRVYSPIQVAAGALLGGPISTVYFLWANYRALGDREGETRMMVAGPLFVAAVVWILLFLPASAPFYLVHLAYGIGARFMAENLQISKQQIEASERFTFHTGWNVAGWTVLFLVIFAIIFLGLALGLDAQGIVVL